MKTLSLKIQIFLFCGALIFSLGCNKRCRNKVIVEQILIPQEILNYVDFNVGTYWIYQDSSSGRLDSAVVVSNRHFMENDSTINDCGEKILIRQFENIEVGYLHFDLLSGYSSSLYIQTFNNSLKRSNSSYNGIFVINDMDWFELAYPFNNYSNGAYNIYESKTDSLLVLGKTYKEILVVKRKYTQGAPNYFANTYYGSKIGKLTVREYSTPLGNNVNNLVRYKIR